ncbi:uncharacterized protein LOC143856000 [Tasmannia lanceolata]|uniref:uncharacterized protein LOC143856000 n=1 Tax=Tasmannia lanceolata TaxID=3420 RepID=UPI004064862A
MPGLSEDIVQYRLPLIPGIKPKKQKLCKLKIEWELKVYEEVKKLLEVKFIQVVEYPEWLTNIVPVPKKDGKVRMCIDFRDLNKASPKDDFPLPNIDLLVDNTAGHALLSFMDGFSGYNQIKMALEDMMKITFITQWGTYCYRLLKKNSLKKWNDECQEAFKKVKQCLSLPPFSSPDIPGQPLLLYLSITDTVMGCMLAQQEPESKREKPIYYISKKMLEYEIEYTILEKTCLALVWATQRLRHYLLSNKVLLHSRMDPLKYLFEKPALTGRIARWLLLLSKFDITYITQKSVKGRVIAEQLADAPVEENAFLKAKFSYEEIMELEEETPRTRWLMYFDGAVNNQGQEVGAVLVSPKKEYILISIKLQFECMNNIAKYEACITGLEAALALRVQDIDVFGDLILIICQING